MILFLPYKKIYLLFPLLIYSTLGLGNSSMDSFSFTEKWEEAQDYLANKQMEELLVVIKQLEKVVGNKDDPEKGKIAYLLGEYWYEKEIWRKAADHLEKAIRLLNRDSMEALVLAEAYLVRGYCFHELEEYDQALLNYKKSLPIKQNIYGKNHQKVSSVYFNIGYIHQEKRELIKSDEAFKKGLEILAAISPSENQDFADLYEELGYNQFLKSNFHASIDYLEKALVIKKRILPVGHKDLVYTYNYLGLAYHKFGHFGKAIDYLNKSLQIVKEQPERDNYQEGLLNFHIGECYLALKEEEKAFKYFDKAINANKENKYVLYAIYRLKGKAASEKRDNYKADIYFDLALKGFQSIARENKEYLGKVYIDIIDQQIKIGAYDVALSYINKALKLDNSIHTKFDYFPLYEYKGYCYQQLGDLKNAYFYFSKAEEVNGGHIAIDQANMTQLENKISLNRHYVAINLNKEGFNVDLSILLTTDSLLDETVTLIDYVIRTYQDQNTKENFIDNFYSVFDDAIQVKYHLYRLTNKKRFLAEAFTLSEKSKNLVMLASLKNINALASAGVPNLILEKEKTLRNDITYLENKRFEENKRRTLDHKIIRELNGKLFDLKQEYYALQDEIKIAYPSYHQLKFEPIHVSIKDIQQQILHEKQSIIEYFVGKDNIFVFLIKKDSFEIFSLPKEKDLDKRINQFRHSIYSYRPPEIYHEKKGLSKQNEESKTYKLGFELYQTIFAPIQDQLTRKLTIIADGKLGYLPFDALLTAPFDRNSKIKKPAYLMDKHLISYAHSINWLNGLFDKKEMKFDQNFVGLAPEFKGMEGENSIADFRIGLGPLKYNQEEVNSIKSSIGGKVVTGAIATRQAFLDHIQKGQVLHLATHGKSNDKQGDYSYLAFAEPMDPTDNQFLYVRDLFNLKIPAELVVLSACETGLGEIKRGEGIVGIGKGFSYAGAKSMVTTLWRVSDNSTANFMPLFYENLKKGMPKDEALWAAKNTFIQTYRNAGHPFFWSGYVAYGNMEPITFQHYNLSSAHLFLGMGASIVFLLLFFFMLRLLKPLAPVPPIQS